MSTAQYGKKNVSIYAHYVKQLEERVHAIKPNMSIVHNRGIRFGRRDMLMHNSHLEVESLPSGGWGYDYYPMYARYMQPFGKDIVGMTGRFNKNWGEFGGYKHPNAIRFETSLNLLHGMSCSVGDHLHPDGLMDPVVYSMVGKAYREVEAKEPWCSNVANTADVALLAVESLGPDTPRKGRSDIGAYRILQAGPGMVESVNGIYFAWHAFADYGENGSTFMKECILYALNRLLDSAKTLETNLPSLGTVGLQHQKERCRYVNHLIYAFPVKRGKDMEVIEDIVPIRDIEVALRLPVQAKKVYLAPQMEEIPYMQEKVEIRYTLPVLDCHQMIVIDY